MVKPIFAPNQYLIYINKCINLVLFKQQPLKCCFTYHINDSKIKISSIGAPCMLGCVCLSYCCTLSMNISSCDGHCHFPDFLTNVTTQQRERPSTALSKTPLFQEGVCHNKTATVCEHHRGYCQYVNSLSNKKQYLLYRPF